MNLALSLAEKGRITTQPNPMVGAVIVNDGEIVGEGYHERTGEAHAEIRAIGQAGDRTRGGTMYVSLEPCCHQGRTPPCTEAIIAAGISRVICCDRDPNPIIDGNGLRVLAENGIFISEGLLREEERLLNEIYYRYIVSSVPFVTLKMAQNLDGYIAFTDSKEWVTGLLARRVAHDMRASHLAIMVGIGTVLDDNPALNIRYGQYASSCRQPLRVIIDSTLRLETGMFVVDSADEISTVVYTGVDLRRKRAVHLIDKGLELIETPQAENGKLDLRWILADLGGKNISSVLVEGGKRLATSLLCEDLVDRLVLFVNPSIAGEGAGTTGFGRITTEGERRSVNLRRVQVSRAGEDILISGYPEIMET